MTKQHNNPKVIVAAATGYSTDQWSVTFYGPMGHITLFDDGKYAIGGSASCAATGGYKDPARLEGFQKAYRAHPALTGKPLPPASEEISYEEISSPAGEDWGNRTVITKTDWLGNKSVYNCGYRAGGQWVDAWVS